MTLRELKTKCLSLHGVERVRIAKLGDGCFVRFQEVWTGTAFWRPSTFIFLEGWENSIKVAKVEYERFYTGGKIK